MSGATGSNGQSDDFSRAEGGGGGKSPDLSDGMYFHGSITPVITDIDSTMALIGEYFRSLTKSHRKDFIEKYLPHCSLCGTIDLPCYCAPEFDE